MLQHHLIGKFQLGRDLPWSHCHQLQRNCDRACRECTQSCLLEHKYRQDKQLCRLFHDSLEWRSGRTCQLGTLYTFHHHRSRIQVSTSHYAFQCSPHTCSREGTARSRSCQHRRNTLRHSSLAPHKYWQHTSLQGRSSNASFRLSSNIRVCMQSECPIACRGMTYLWDS